MRIYNRLSERLHGWGMNPVRLSVAFLSALLAAMPAIASPALIPMPQSVTPHDGEFRITDTTTVAGEGDAGPTAAYLANAPGLHSDGKDASSIRLRLVSRKIIPGQEAYRLGVTPDGVRIEASDPRGLFHGAQTLLQLIATDPAGSRSIGSVDIRD